MSCRVHWDPLPQVLTKSLSSRNILYTDLHLREGICLQGLGTDSLETTIPQNSSQQDTLPSMAKMWAFSLSLNVVTLEMGNPSGFGLGPQRWHFKSLNSLAFHRKLKPSGVLLLVVLLKMRGRIQSTGIPCVTELGFPALQILSF